MRDWYDLSQTVEISAKASANIDQLLKIRKRSIGSIEGTLETISVHGKPRIIVYLGRTRKAVTCRFDGEGLLDQATSLLRRRVVVSGIVHSNAKGEPMRVDAEHIRALRRNDELPSIAEMGGMDPNFTGDMSTEEYLRSIRVG